jgi:hypothetical protein
MGTVPDWTVAMSSSMLSAHHPRRTRTRIRILMDLVVLVEHVDGRVAVVVEVRDGVSVEHAEVEVALGVLEIYASVV